MLVVPANNVFYTKLFAKAWLFIGHAFFACALFLFSSAYADDCRLQNLDRKLQPASLEQVVDGDTVWLASGRKLRLIGINTPELGGNEPLALAAKHRLAGILADQKLKLLVGEQKQDRHHRLLGHLFLADGRNVEALMLREGFGYPVAIPPNLALADCHRQAADEAQKAGRGVWQSAARSSSSLGVGDAGFARVRGRLESFSEAGGSWWLAMEGPLVLRIAAEHQRYFEPGRLRAWQGEELEVTGWVVDRSATRAGRQYAPLMLLLTHPLHVRRLP